MSEPRLALVPIADLYVGDNIRDDVGDVSSLAESIAAVGVLEPIIVWPSEDGSRAEVGMGQRRLAAAKLAGLVHVPCVLRSRPDERERILMQLAENHERADMSPIDEARAFTDLMRLGINRRQIANAIRKSESWVYNRTRLLDLPKVLRDACHRGDISATVASEFPFALANDPDVLLRLQRLTRITDELLRGLIRNEYLARKGSAVAITRSGCRAVNISVDHHEVAKAQAKAARVTIAEWVQGLIDRAVAG